MASRAALAACVLILAPPPVAVRAQALLALLERAQCADGHWPAADFGGRAEATLRVNALLLLAILGDGSTSRQGPDRERVRRGVAWLRSQQDARGRLGMRADADWVLDHAIGTYALAEDSRTAGHRAAGSVAAVLRATDALHAWLAVARPAPPVELHLWAEMTVRSLRASAAQRLEADPMMPVALAMLAHADALARQLAARPPAAPDCVRTCAAALLLDELRGKTPAGSDVLPAAWPQDPMLDPLATFYATVALWLRGGPPWQAASRLLSGKVVRTQIRASDAAAGTDLQGTWDPGGPFGEWHGRLGTTAAALLVMEVYYRYCRLQVCSGD